MKKSTVAGALEVPVVIVKVFVVLALLAASWLGWAIGAGLAWHYTGRVDYTVLSAMAGLLLAPLATLVDTIP
jgi:hypothetical protein